MTPDRARDKAAGAAANARTWAAQIEDDRIRQLVGSLAEAIDLLVSLSLAHEEKLEELEEKVNGE